VAHFDAKALFLRLI